ncbi:hypothetical protein EH171_03505 [Enterovibrio baiacu]|nr:hypothetical protein [Enterovibrio baiacu]
MKAWFLFLLVILAAPVNAELRLEKSSLQTVSETSLLVIKGMNLSDSEVILVIRADDTVDPGYADRANIERVLTKGEFELHVPFASMRTPGGRQLNLNALENIIIFPGEKKRGFALMSADVETPKPLGENVFAWDLGPVGSAIWPGFKPLTIKSGLLSGQGLNPIDRSARMQAADSLTIDGIRGIDTAALPLPAGDWQITFWLRDAGEWEYLPHPLQREIRVNGETVYRQNRSPKEWIEQVYLKRRDMAVTPKSNSWDLYGERKSDRVTFDITSNGDPVIVKLYGDSTDAQFVSGILAVPADNPMILDMLTRQRQAWWEKNWPVSDWTAWPTGSAHLKPAQKGTTSHTDNRVNAAPDTSALVEFSFEQGNIPGAPMVMINKPKRGETALNVSWHWSQWSLTRTHISSTLLSANDNFLRHGLMPINDGVAMPRKLVLRVDIPKGTPAGTYTGELHVMMQRKSLRQPITINVVEASLPALSKPVGIYLEKPVHYGWFKDIAHLGNQAMMCDLSYLRKLGLTGISPPFPTPYNEDEQRAFEKLSVSLNKLGYTASMAYAPAKRLSQAIGTGNAANVVAQIEATHKQRLQPSPYWSIADEPSNPGNVDLFEDMHRHFSMFAPTAKLAGHLNHDKDKAYLPLFDLVLINNGFGADKDDIQEAQSDEREIWLYNLPNPRASAGFYLWQTQADGFLKWHGRMPTADPFDPTDGREFDVQFLYPTENPCPEEPDIHRDLYEIMEGIVDYRWMLWLEQQAQTHTAANALLSTLKRAIPDEWEDVPDIDQQQLNRWRQQIIELARESE